MIACDAAQAINRLTNAWLTSTLWFRSPVISQLVQYQELLYEKDHKFSNSLKNPAKVHVVNSFCYSERLSLDPMKNTADPDPGGYDPRSRGCDPGSHPF